jgi:hypothetical protein
MFEVWTGQLTQKRSERELLQSFVELQDAIEFANTYGADKCTVEMGLPEVNKYFAKA